MGVLPVGSVGKHTFTHFFNQSRIRRKTNRFISVLVIIGGQLHNGPDTTVNKIYTV